MPSRHGRAEGRRGAIRIGISGWRYPPWRGTFYPKGLPQRRELAYVADHLNSLEINGTFYSLQPPACFRRWRDATPEDFVFAVKGGRFITHMKRLNDVAAPVANFFASGVLLLGGKLGPILWQFPPAFRFDAARMEAFFALLPHDSEAAARLAAKHDHRVKAVDWSDRGPQRPLRHAVEIRHRSFEDKAFFRLLRQYNIALVAADAVDWPYIDEHTADFAYARLHGSEELYASGYDEAALDDWAGRVRRWSGGRRPRDVYVYFDNDAKVRAPFDAIGLAARCQVSGARNQDRNSRRKPQFQSLAPGS